MNLNMFGNVPPIPPVPPPSGGGSGNSSQSQMDEHKKRLQIEDEELILLVFNLL